MLSSLLNENTITINTEYLSWQDALIKTGECLLKSGAITQGYLDSIIHLHNTLGPYYVIAPGIAMPHSRAENGALKLGLSLFVSKNDIIFHSDENDPVNLIFLFSAPDNHSHLNMLMSLSELFTHQDDLHSIKNADSIDSILSIIQKY